MQVSQVFFSRYKLNTSARMDNEPVDVPKVRPSDNTCALYKPASAASVAMVARAVMTTDRISQNEQRPDFDFFLENLNISRKGKRTLFYAAKHSANNFIQSKRIDGRNNPRSKIQITRCK
jgi:hypothetical protein